MGAGRLAHLAIWGNNSERRASGAITTGVSARPSKYQDPSRGLALMPNGRAFAAGNNMHRNELMLSVDIEYTTKDGNSVCGWDHQAMQREIVRLRLIRQMAVDLAVSGGKMSPALLRALMSPPEINCD